MWPFSPADNNTEVLVVNRFQRGHYWQFLCFCENLKDILINSRDFWFSFVLKISKEISDDNGGYVLNAENATSYRQLFCFREILNKNYIYVFTDVCDYANANFMGCSVYTLAKKLIMSSPARPQIGAFCNPHPQRKMRLKPLLSPNDSLHQFPILRNPLFKIQSKKDLPWTRLSLVPPGREESSYLWRKISGTEYISHLDPGGGGLNRGNISKH